MKKAEREKLLKQWREDLKNKARREGWRPSETAMGLADLQPGGKYDKKLRRIKSKGGEKNE